MLCVVGYVESNRKEHVFMEGIKTVQILVCTFCSKTTRILVNCTSEMCLPVIITVSYKRGANFFKYVILL